MQKIPLIFGTGLSSCKDYDGLYLVIKAALENGIYGFDTAPSYRTEEILGSVLNRCINELQINREQLFLQTKIDPWQMKDGNIKIHVESALEKMQLSYFDSVLIHWPVPEYLESTWNELAELKNCDIVKKIGICNLRTRHIIQVLNYTCKPDIIQIERNPLRTCMDEVKVAQSVGIEMQAYSPLCKMDERLKNSEILNDLGKKYNKNVGQIILRWHLQTGYIPIFTTTKVSRVKEYTDIFDFELTIDEINDITALNVNYKIYLESCICPGF